MKSKTLLPKGGFALCNRTLFQKDILRFWPIWVVELVVYFLSTVLPIQSLLTNPDNMSVMNLVGQVDVMLFAPMNALWCLAVGLCLFGYLTKEREAYMIHSFPIRRETIFFSHYFSGLTMLIVPHLFNMFFIAGLFAGKYHQLLFPLMLCFLELVIEILFFYSLVCCVVMLTGNGLMTSAIYAVLNVLVWGVCMIMVTLSELFVFGSNGVLQGSVERICRVLTPALRFMGFGMSRMISSPQDSMAFTVVQGSVAQVGRMAVYLIPAAVFVLLAVFLYRIRQLEAAGDMLAFSWGKPVFRIVFVFCASCLLTILLFQIFDNSAFEYYEMRFYGCIVAIVLTTVLFYLVANMILEKTFFIWKKTSYLRMGIFAAAMGCMLVVMRQTSFGAGIPKLSNVQYAHISFYNDAKDAIWVTDREQLLMLQKLNRDILKKGGVDLQGQAESKPDDLVYFEVTYYERGVDDRPVTWTNNYLLATDGSLANEVSDFFRGQRNLAEAYFTKDYTDFDIHLTLFAAEDGKNEETGRVELVYDNSLDLDGLTSGERERLLSALITDIKEGNIKPHCLSGPEEIKAVLDIAMTSKKQAAYGLRWRQNSLSMCLSKKATQTLQVLEDIPEAKELLGGAGE